MSRSWPTPTRADHKKFVETEGWQLLKNVRGNKGDHYRYSLEVDGDVLYTRISHPLSAKEPYGNDLWAHILRDQLKVAEDEFWACVKDGKPPQRSQPKRPPGEPVPPDVIWQLIHKVGVPEDDVRTMSKLEAVERLRRYYIEGR